VPCFVVLPEQCLPVRSEGYSLDKDKGAVQVSALTAAALGRRFQTSVLWTTA